MKNWIVLSGLSRCATCTRSRLAGRAWVGVLCAVVVLAPESLVATEIYKWRNAQGQVVYSDQRPNGPAERVNIEPPPRESEEDRARRESQRAAMDQTLAARAERDRAQVAEEERVKAERAKRCTAARSQQSRFSYDGRKYDVDSEGKRVYYSAAEIDQKRAEVSQQISENCPPAPRR